MNSIEELIQKWEQEIAKVNPFKEDNAKWYDSEWTNGRYGAISQFLEDLKNLPNELRAVNRNEQLKEFFPVTCFRCGEKFNDITDAEGHRCVLRKNG